MTAFVVKLTILNDVAGSGFDASMYTTVEPTMSTNPNVFFHRGVHPGMMY